MADSSSSMQSVLVSLASSKKVVSYDELMQTLNISTERQLEDLIIQSIYQDVIQGKLNPKERRVEFSDWSSQKVENVDLDFMVKILGGWSEHCKSFINTLAKEAESSNEKLLEETNREKKIEQEVENIKKNLISNGKFSKSDLIFPSDLGRPFKNEAKRHKGTMRNIMKRSNN